MNEIVFYRGKRILITGFTGFLGTEIMRLLSGTDCSVTGITREKDYVFPFPEPQYQLRILPSRLDDPDFWKDALQNIDLVFHLAAQTNLEQAQKDPDADYQINVLPMKLLTESALGLKKPLRVIFSGTATQAGIPDHILLDENQKDRPSTVYDVHKLEAEHLLKDACKNPLFSGVSLRLCNLYGPGPAPKSSERGILNQAVYRAFQNQSLEWYEGHDYIRDYLFVTDAARAFLMAGEKADQLSGKHFILGSGQGWRFSEAFKIAAEKAGRFMSPVEVKSISLSKHLDPIHRRNVVADSSAFRKETGWIPEITFARGIENLVAYNLSLHPSPSLENP